MNPLLDEIASRLDWRAARWCADERVPVLPRFARHTGAWGEKPVHLECSIRAGRGSVRRLQVARTGGPPDGMASLTVIGLGDASRGLPIFGLDLVLFRGKLGLAIMDVTPAPRRLEAGSVLSLRSAREALMTRSTGPKALPEDTPFSEHACFASPQDGAEEAVLRCVDAYLDVFERETRREGAGPAGHLYQASYLQKLSRVKKQAKALARIFGEEWTSSFFDEVFFRTDGLGITRTGETDLRDAPERAAEKKSAS